MSQAQANDAEKNIEMWKVLWSAHLSRFDSDVELMTVGLQVKKLIKRLEAARGNGTSMISLIIRKLAPYVMLYM